MFCVLPHRTARRVQHDCLAKLHLAMCFAGLCLSVAVPILVTLHRHIPVVQVAAANSPLASRTLHEMHVAYWQHIKRSVFSCWEPAPLIICAMHYCLLFYKLGNSLTSNLWPITAKSMTLQHEGVPNDASKWQSISHSLGRLTSLNLVASTEFVRVVLGLADLSFCKLKHMTRTSLPWSGMSEELTRPFSCFAPSQSKSLSAIPFPNSAGNRLQRWLSSNFRQLRLESRNLPE